MFMVQFRRIMDCPTNADALSEMYVAALGSIRHPKWHCWDIGEFDSLEHAIEGIQKKDWLASPVTKQTYLGLFVTGDVYWFQVASGEYFQVRFVSYITGKSDDFDVKHPMDIESPWKIGFSKALGA